MAKKSLLNFRRRKLNKVYTDGVRVPKHANLRVFNFGYYVGIENAKKSTGESLNAVFEAFLSGFVQGSLQTFNWSEHATARFLGTTTGTLRKYCKISRATPEKPSPTPKPEVKNPENSPQDIVI